MTDDPFEQTRMLLQRAQRIVAFTGAGISAESGIPTFRGEGGLWSNVDVEEFGTPWGIEQLIRTDPRKLVDHLDQRARVLFTAVPNPAHVALGQLEAMEKLTGVVTQNVDGLHEAGGTRTIYKLHGDLLQWRCLSCAAISATAPTDVLALIDAIREIDDSDTLLAQLPKCTACSAHTRPSVVLFGEMLPDDQVRGAQGLLAQTDCLLIIGTSGVVEPAASLARDVARRGIPTIEMNMEPSELTRYATVSLFGAAGEHLPRLLDALD